LFDRRPEKSIKLDTKRLLQRYLPESAGVIAGSLSAGEGKSVIQSMLFTTHSGAISYTQLCLNGRAAHETSVELYRGGWVAYLGDRCICTIRHDHSGGPSQFCSSGARGD
jgi:hypothetical protein